MSEPLVISGKEVVASMTIRNGLKAAGIVKEISTYVNFRDPKNMDIQAVLSQCSDQIIKLICLSTNLTEDEVLDIGDMALFATLIAKVMEVNGNFFIGSMGIVNGLSSYMSRVAALTERNDGEEVIPVDPVN